MRTNTAGHRRHSVTTTEPVDPAAAAPLSTGRMNTKALSLLAFAVVATGCDAGGGPGSSGAPGGTADTGLRAPAFLASARAIDADLLDVTLTVGDTSSVDADDETMPVRRGDVYLWSFTLEDNQVYPFRVLWTYRVPGREEPLPIALATRTVSIASRTREIRVRDEDYDRSFDFDGDSIDNLTEIDRGTDPLVADTTDPVAPAALAGGAVAAGALATRDLPITPRAGQGDCRTTALPRELAADAERPRDLFRFGTQAFSDTRALAFDRERHAYHATFVLEAAGDLVIEQRGGLPTDTDAVLYDRRAGAVDFAGSALVAERADPAGTADGLPARIAVRGVRDGLYCYTLFENPAADIRPTPLSDVVLHVEFTPAAP